MNRKWSLLLIATAVGLGGAAAPAQSLDDLNIQIHGYATQGFLYTTQNNILTTKSSDGSPAWTEAVVNITSQPIPKLRVAVQGRYFLLGNLGNNISLDWAMADYKQNDKFGVRFGKIKVPSGLLNEVQDIDPAYLWALLPQSVYQIGSRNGQLSEYGGAVYGTLALGSQMGKLEYRGWGGELAVLNSDGDLLSLTEAGLNLPDGLNFIQTGAALHWRTPLNGLMVGASVLRKNELRAAATFDGAVSGTFSLKRQIVPDYFFRYEKDKWMVAAEYERTAGYDQAYFGGPPPPYGPFDVRGDFAMASYKATGNLTIGIYNGQSFNKAGALGPSRYSKDWTVSGRYDFNQYLYLKAEQHFIDGTALNFDANLNPGGLKPSTKLTILKIGVSF